MSVGGICQVCESGSADERCDRCGALVCSEHHDSERGVCVECVTETGAGDGNVPAGDRDHPDVDRYQF